MQNEPGTSAPTSKPIANPSWIVRLFRPIAYLWLWATGWRLEGEVPDLPKFVLVAAPHTSNWDLPNVLAAGLHFGLRIHWMGKTSIFKWPFGGLMRWLGGIAVDRSRSNNAVTQMAEEFAKRDTLYLTIAPAGTRTQALEWKTGFYHIAHQAKVPLVFGFMDYKNKSVGIKGMMHTTGDFESDLAKIKAVYADIQGKNPHK
jgi:1-acyl-sn-glycerol-3-phosphate acyltransferase